MDDAVHFGQNEADQFPATQESTVTTPTEGNAPGYDVLASSLSEASSLVDDIVLKKYLHRLTDLEIVPLDERLKNISDIRLFKIMEMVYQNNEYSTYKFASVFHAVQNLNCGVFIIADSDGEKTEFYMGVRSFDDRRTTKSLKDTLRNALCGQFPGVRTKDLLDPDAESFLSKIPTRNIAAVSCVAGNKDDGFNNNENFIQGLEKLAIAMQGQKYTVIVLAKSTPVEQLEEIRKSYEMIYTQLSPFANMDLSYGTNTALSVSDALSHGTATGESYSRNKSVQTGISRMKGTSESHSVSKQDALGSIAKVVGHVALGIAGLATAPMTGGASVAAAAAVTMGQMAVGAFAPKTKTDGTSVSESFTENKSESYGETSGNSWTRTENMTRTEGTTSGRSNTMQLKMQNKTLIDTLKKIDLQLERLDECESVGMWECAAYILSDAQETAEMAAGMYKALMKGEDSGVETSSINFWGRHDKNRLPVLREYITSFVHPVFEYRTDSSIVPVTAASLVSSNELAIQMGLPRKSVRGFPVIEHSEFGKEVLADNTSGNGGRLRIGTVFDMGRETGTEVCLDINSLVMHTFITGSTGSGKSNAICSLLEQILEARQEHISFMVIEPAKGEYKNRFGHRKDVHVYGTNAKKTELLRINPFSFPDEIHVLEHIDRLIEIFSVCWPMYAAMPAVMKDAVERAYMDAGWDLGESACRFSDGDGLPLYPCFGDILRQISIVMEESKYSPDSKGDYTGALCTRIKSLTNGLYGQIFTPDELPMSELYDRNVIIDLSRVGSVETKALIMGLLVMKLQEYRMSVWDGNNAGLRHLTVLEEAHNLLKRTSSEQGQESANMLGKSVEMLANSIAEMRAYGEGFVIADQSPGLLDLSAIRNTNTKIILRLPEMADRELVGRAASLDEGQILELSKLGTGIAAVYQNDWLEPVLCHISPCSAAEMKYVYCPKNEREQERFKSLIDYIMLPAPEKLKLDADKISELEKTVYKIQLTADVKVKLLRYFKETDSERIQRQRNRIVYSMFNSETALLLSKTERHDINVWRDMMLERLEPNIMRYGVLEQNKILAILAKEQMEKNLDDESERLYIDLMRSIGKKERGVGIV